MNIYDYIILFFIYSFLGFLIEVIVTLACTNKLVNRGFLIGPYCPIYGVGAILVTLLLTHYIDRPLGLFILCIFICAIIEYFTSYILEKIFNTRWWDYSNKKLNINGRICVENLIPFGIGCLIVIYILNPFFTNLLLQIPLTIKKIISIVTLIIFVIDIIISFKIIWKFKKFAKNIKKDNTEKVTKYVRKEILHTNKKLYTRIVNAFPKFEITKIFKKKKKIKKNKRK